MNLWPPQTSQVPGFAGGSPSTNFFSSPASWSCLISSAPPMYLPPMKTRGSVSFLFSRTPRIVFSSSMNLQSIERSRSSIDTRKLRRIAWTSLQSSNVRRTTRRLVRYTTIRFSDPGSEIDGSDSSATFSSTCTGNECGLGSGLTSSSGPGCDLGWESGGGWPEKTRRTALARRTRWKILEDFLVWVGFSETGSSAQRVWMSLNDEQEKLAEELRWIRVFDLVRVSHMGSEIPRPNFFSGEKEHNPNTEKPKMEKKSKLFALSFAE